MAKQNVRACQTCHGNGTVQVNEIQNGKSVWVTKKCPARCNNGKIIISTI